MIDTRNFDRAPLKDIRVKDNLVGIRTPQVIIKREGGEYMKGDLLDANTTMVAVKAAMDEAHKGYLPLNGGGTIYKDDKYSTTYITNSGIQFKNHVIASGLYCNSCLYGHKFQLRTYIDENKDFFDRNYYLDASGLTLSRSNSKDDKYYNFLSENKFGWVLLDKNPLEHCFYSYTYITNPNNGKIRYESAVSPIFISLSIRDENGNKLGNAVFNTKYISIEDNGSFVRFGSNGDNRMGLLLYCRGILNSDKTKIIYPSVFFNTDGLTDEERKNVGVYISGTTDNDVVASKHGVKTIGKDFPSMELFKEIEKQYKLQNYAYGIAWDDAADSDKFDRIGNFNLHLKLPIQSQFKGCVVKDGKLNYWLDPNDWSKKDDGTPSVLDGTDGDVCVHTPRFYGKSEKIGTLNKVLISELKIDDTWDEIPEMYIGAYACTIHNDNGVIKTATVVNTTPEYRGGERDESRDLYLETDVFRTLLGKPISNITLDQAREYANNAGCEIISYDIYKWIFVWCPYIEYACGKLTWNYIAQPEGELRKGGLGPHEFKLYNIKEYLNNNPITPCGYMNEYGNFSGSKQVNIDVTLDSGKTVKTNDKSKETRYRGFENIRGLLFNLDGIYATNFGNGCDIYITDDPLLFSNIEDNLSKCRVIKREGVFLDGIINPISHGDIITKKGSSDSLPIQGYPIIHKYLMMPKSYGQGSLYFSTADYDAPVYPANDICFRTVIRINNE